MFGHIILRDVPKRAVQLDLSIFEIQGGFRGFAEILPGLHYVSVEMDAEMLDGFWCYGEPSAVVVKVFDYDSWTFQDPDPKIIKQFTQMARSGAMNRALIPVMQRDSDFANAWKDLVSHVMKDDFPIILHQEMPMIPPENIS